MIHEVRRAAIQAGLGSRCSTGDFVVVIEDVADEGVVVPPDDCSLGAVVYRYVAADGYIGRRGSGSACVQLNSFGVVVLDKVVDDQAAILTVRGRPGPIDAVVFVPVVGAVVVNVAAD